MRKWQSGVVAECLQGEKLTRCLMGRSREFGGDVFWAERLGWRVAGLGGHGLWREMAALTDRLAG